MDNYLFQKTKEIANWSLDPSTKVGCLIVKNDFAITGVNDFPKGIPSEWWNDRSKKYSAVVHAEVKALLKAGLMADGATMYVTHHPCRACAPVIAAAGIVRVVCPPGPWRDDPEVVASVADAAELFTICGVEVVDAE